MLGNPKFSRGDVVEFDIFDNGEKFTLRGTVEIIDAYGTFEQCRDASYDIMVQKSHFSGEPCLYKHIEESFVREPGGEK